MTEQAPTYWIPVAFLAGVALAFIFMTLGRRKTAPPPDVTMEIPPPLKPDKYEEVLDRIREGYLASMREYDRLIPSASGGALVVSMSFVGSFAPVAPPSSKWLLGLAWFLLATALLSPILGQYVSTRIKVWSEQYVTARQHPPDKRKEPARHKEWRKQTLELDRRKRKNQHAARYLNVLAGASLVLGLMALGAFAVVAVPFGVPPIGAE